MEVLSSIGDFIIKLLKDPRTVILEWIAVLGPVGVLAPLFLVVFIETGVVFFPFLPGDSLIFAAGVFSAEGGVPEGGQNLNIYAVLVTFYAAAILGNTSNYWIARFFGDRIIKSGKAKALTPERLDKLNGFFDRFGGLTIVITRFMPFFRTFAPFVSGLGRMNFLRFTVWNIIGGVSWVSLFAFLGYFFGGVPFVQEHFSLIVIAIVLVSVTPAVIGVIKAFISSRKKKKVAKASTESSINNQAEAAQINADADQTGNAKQNAGPAQKNNAKQTVDAAQTHNAKENADTAQTHNAKENSKDK